MHSCSAMMTLLTLQRTFVLQRQDFQASYSLMCRAAERGSLPDNQVAAQKLHTSHAIAVQRDISVPHYETWDANMSKSSPGLRREGEAGLCVRILLRVRLRGDTAGDPPGVLPELLGLEGCSEGSVGGPASPSPS